MPLIWHLSPARKGERDICFSLPRKKIRGLSPKKPKESGGAFFPLWDSPIFQEFLSLFSSRTAKLTAGPWSALRASCTWLTGNNNNSSSSNNNNSHSSSRTAPPMRRRASSARLTGTTRDPGKAFLLTFFWQKAIAIGESLAAVALPATSEEGGPASLEAPSSRTGSRGGRRSASDASARSVGRQRKMHFPKNNVKVSSVIPKSVL